jgi:hypothetical protein
MSGPDRLNSTLVGTIAAIALSGGLAYTQGDIKPINDLPNPYEAQMNWGTMPAGRTWGATSALAVDNDGKSIWVFERCGKNSCDGSDLPTVLKFDENGKLLKSFGAGMFIFPHSIHVDRDGSVWVVDAGGNKEGTKGHVVVKFSPEGKVLMTLGKPGQKGNGPDTFNEPNAVVVAPNGDIFVGDGHSGQNVQDPTVNARIVKFDKNGKFIKAWGKWGSAPGDFKTPHALAFDSKGRLFVADRGNVRIQIFDQDGTFLDQWKQFSRVSGIAIAKDDTLYAIDSESSPRSNPGWMKGLRIGSAKDGKVQFFIPGHKTDKPSPGNDGSAMGEGVAVDAAGNIFGGEVHLYGVTKFVKKRGRATQ